MTRRRLEVERAPSAPWVPVLPARSGPLARGLRLGLHLALRAYLRSYHRFRVHGVEHFPCDASFMIVCNHTSHLDALCLLSSLPLRRVQRAYPAAAADYFFSSVPRALLASLLMNGLPFDRHGGGLRSVELCRRVLGEERSVLILFPEGTRSPTGEIRRFRAGVARVVAGTGVPVVPCYLAGAHRAWPKGRAWPRPGPLELRIGEAMRFESVDPARSGAIRGICVTLQRAVEALAPGAPGVGAARLGPPHPRHAASGR